MSKLLFVLLSLALLFNCTSESAKIERQKTVDTVKILDVFPPITEILQQGANVKIKYKVRYNLLSAESGTLTLVVQSASNESLANEFYVVYKGEGIEILEANIIVPNTRAIQVFTPLSPQGMSSTNVVESRFYKVIK